MVWWQNEMNDILRLTAIIGIGLWFDDKMKWTIFCQLICQLKSRCGLMTKWNERYFLRYLNFRSIVVVWWQNEMNDIINQSFVWRVIVVVWWQNEMNDIKFESIELFKLVVVWWQNEMNDISFIKQEWSWMVVVWWQNEMNDIFMINFNTIILVVVWWQNEMNDIYIGYSGSNL